MFIAYLRYDMKSIEKRPLATTPFKCSKFTCNNLIRHDKKIYTNSILYTYSCTEHILDGMQKIFKNKLYSAWVLAMLDTLAYMLLMLYQKWDYNGESKQPVKLTGKKKMKKMHASRYVYITEHCVYSNKTTHHWRKIIYENNNNSKKFNNEKKKTD